MRSLLQRLLNPWLWLALGLLCGLTGPLSNAWQPASNRTAVWANRHSQAIEANFRQLDTRLGALLRDSALLNDLATGCLDAPDTELLRQTPFALYIFENNRLVWWNSNQVLPDPLLPELGEQQVMVRLANGFYALRGVSWAQYRAIGLIPIRREYSLVNRYLEPSFLPELGIPEHALLLGSDLSTNTIRDARGTPVFSLLFPRGKQSAWSWQLLLGLACLFFSFLGLYLLARRWILLGHNLAATLLLIIALYLLHTVFRLRLWPTDWFHLPLFDPHYYASPGIAGSLGQLIMDAALAGVLGLFLLRMVSPGPWFSKLPGPPWLSAALPVVLLLGLFRIVVNVFFSLVADSNISFNLDNFLVLDAFSFAGLLAAALLLANLFLMGRWLARAWKRVALTAWQRYSAMALGSIIYVMLVVFLPLGDEPFMFQHLFSAWIFLGLSLWFSTADRQENGLPGLLIWAAYFAAFAAALLIRTETQREEAELRRYAYRLASDEDPVMEYLFAGVANAIQRDPVVRSLFADAYPAVRRANEQIVNSYLSQYYDRYRISLSYFDAQGRALHSDPSPGKIYLDSLIQAQSEETGAEGLFHLLHGGRMAYLARIPVQAGGTATATPDRRGTDSIPLEGARQGGGTGMVYLRLESKVLSGASLYPELLMRDAGAKDPEGYDHALYRGDRLLSQNGDFPYPLTLPDAWNAGQEFLSLEDEGAIHLIHRTRGNKVVVLSREPAGWIVPLSLFSYLFLFILILTTLLVAPVYLIQRLMGPQSLAAVFSFSLRGRIQSFVVLLTLLSFVIIGAITISYFNQQSQSYHRSRLLRKLTAVASEIEYESSGGAQGVDPIRRNLPDWPFDRGIRSDLGALSEIHAIDLNIYDTLGILQQSSQPDIFTRGLLGRMMDPAAWASMSRAGSSHWVQTEQIGNLAYLSAYRPLQTSAGKTVAYLHMPYFAKEKNQRQEVAGFMVALINVYVLLLVAAGLVALGISNSVTRSLTRISAQFQKIRVGERNEPIAWKSNDEIGLLVAEYNKMLGELERSAALLARSERESAWREMARQVAHEIKNPLTPMRLSIQHLQRTIAAGDPRAEELTARVSRTLLEQIETLSHIATEFSNFAQMPTPSPEQVDLGAVLRSVVELYEAEEVADIQLSMPAAGVQVWADRQQLQRVFSNLLKNAIQAIPDDRKGQIRVVMASFAGQVRVQVVDNGSGIDEDQRTRVFVPNFTTKNSGMGLGLAMSKNIVEYAGGRIDFESQPGIGTAFSVTLPVFVPGQGPSP